MAVRRLLLSAHALRTFGDALRQAAGAAAQAATAAAALGSADAAAATSSGASVARPASESAAVRGDTLEFITLEDAAASDCQVHAAWISRDITGLSTKHTVLEPLADCYRVLRRSTDLAWVHTHSAGIDRPIYGELMARGVAVSTSTGANADVVAQTALGAVLALSRRFPQLMAAQAQSRWSPLVAGAPPPDLAGQTVVLVGWGAIARRLQPWLAMLGLQVVVARHGDAPAGPDIETVRYADLASVAPRAQWLVLACPLTAQTRQLVNADVLQRLPAGAMLVNIARGEIVDEAAFIDALRAGHLGGAFLDVFAQEPLPPDSALWSLPGTLISPHSAGHAAGNAARMAAIFFNNLARWLRGASLINRA